VQVSSPVGTRPAFCAGSCPAARATVRSFSRILAGKARFNFPHASRVSRRPSTSWHRPPHRPDVLREGRCAVWAGVLAFSPHLRCGAGVQGCSELLGGFGHRAAPM